MSIKRITNPEEFCQVIDDLHSLFHMENVNQGHFFLPASPESIKLAFGHTVILAWDFFVWASKTNGKFDAAIMFINDKNVKFGKKIFSEYAWVSKNPHAGYKLLQTAIKFARQMEFEIMMMGTMVNHPKHEKIKSFYNKMGFLKDSETYICKL
jgi:hypothetical protein